MNTSRSLATRLLLALLSLVCAATTSAQTVEYLHTDALGSVVAVTDANRTVIERREYEPYGYQLTPAVQNGPGYTGHVQDAATGLTYMQQRYYDPVVGRFLSVDPVEADGKAGRNFNRYWYANNNPYAYTDPDGRLAFLIPVAIIAWRAYSAYDTITSAADNISTLADDSASGSDKALAGAELAGSVVGGKLGRETVSRVADVVKAASNRRVGDFTRGQKAAAKQESAAANGGNMACKDCGKEVDSIKSEKGVPTPDNQAHVHHDPAIKDGGGQHSKPVVLCPECHKKRHLIRE